MQTPEKQILMVDFTCNCATTPEVMRFFFNFLIFFTYKLIACLGLMSRAGLWWLLSSCCCRQWPSLATEVTWWHWYSGVEATKKAFLTKPETTHSSPGFTLPPTLETWQCLAEQFRKKKPNKWHRPRKGVRLENTLNWNQSLQISGCEEIQAFLWSETCFKLILVSPGISRPLGTGAEIQTQVLRQLFLLEILLLPVPSAHKA